MVLFKYTISKLDFPRFGVYFFSIAASWNVLEIITLSASSGSKTVAASDVSGMYTKHGIWTIDNLDVYSVEKTSNSIQKTKTMPAPNVSVPVSGSYTYKTSPRIFITTGTDTDNREHIVEVKIGSGDWQDSVNKPTLFSVSGLLENNTDTIFKPQSQTEGSKTFTVKSVDEDYRSASASVSKTITILPSPFETITANATTVQAAHMNALRTAVNNVRSYYGLVAVSWSEEIIPKKTLIRNWSNHITEIREAIEDIIDVINGFDSGGIFGITMPEWEEIGNTRPSASAMTQIQNLILQL